MSKSFVKKLIATSLSISVSLSPIYALSFSSTAEASTCRLKISTGNLDQAVDRYCQTRADVTRPDPNAEKGEPGWIPYFFENPDECDLGLSFPDLIPDINIDISKINSCEILKAVSSNAVKQVNEKFTEIEGQVKEVTDGDIDEDIDLNDPITRRTGGNP